MKTSEIRTLTDVYEARLVSSGFEEGARKVDRYADSLGGAADSGAIFERQITLNEKAMTRTASILDTMTRRYDPASKAAKELAKFESVLAAEMKKGNEITEAHTRALAKLHENYTKAALGINDNITANARLAASYDPIIKKLSDFNSMIARQDQWIAYQRAAQETVKPVDALAAKMGAHYRETTSMIGRLNSWAAAERAATQEVEKSTKAVKLNAAEKANLSQQLQDVFVMTASGMSPITTLIQQGPQIYDVFRRYEDKAGAAISVSKEFGVGILRFVVNPITLTATAMGVAAYATYQWQRSVEALTVSLNGLGRASGLTTEGATLLADRAARASGISVSSARDITAQMLGAGVRGPALGGAVGLTRDFSRRLGVSQDEAASTLAGALADPARGAEELARRYGLLSFAQREQIIQIANMGDRASASARLVADLRESMKRLEDPTWSIGRAFEDLKTKASDFLSAIGRGIGGGEVENEYERQRRFRLAQQNLIAGRLNEALERQVGLDKLANDAAFAAREITAQTFAQREAVAMEKARVQTLRETKDVTMATMAAEAERLRLLAEAQRKVDDYVRAGQRDRAITGAMTPFERGRMQIIQEGQELLRQIPATVPATRRMRAPAAANDPGPGIGTGTQALIAEAQRRGLEPTEQTFEKLIAEGVGAGKFRGRLIRMDEGFTQSTVDVPNVNRGALERQARAETQARLQAFAANQEREFTSRVNRDIESQSRLLEANAEAFGKSTYEVERARRAAELLNQAKQQGLPLTASLTKEIEAEAARYGELARAQEEAQRSQQRLIENYDLVRSASADTLSSMASDLIRGKSALDSLNESLMRLADRLIQMASERAIEGIFGRMGSGNLAGGGGFFSGLMGLFGFDTGGVIGVHGRPMLAPAAAFANAPRYDRGGTIGSPVPMIGHVGEIVLNAAMQRNVAAGLRASSQGGGPLVVVQDFRSGNAAPAEVKTQTDASGRRRTVVVLREAVADAITSPQGRAALKGGYGVQQVVGSR